MTTNSQPYTGTLISGLTETTEARLLVSDETASQFLDHTEALLRGYYDPALYLGDALKGIEANIVLDVIERKDEVALAGDVQAWFDMRDLQDSMWIRSDEYSVMDKIRDEMD